MKTTFDKWKEGLTPEAFSAVRIEDDGSKVIIYKFPFPRDLGFSKDNILAWANAPAKEENDA